MSHRLRIAPSKSSFGLKAGRLSKGVAGIERSESDSEERDS